MTAPAQGWSSDVLRKVRSLASARVLTQAISIAWFVFAARILDAGELGVLAAGLVTFSAVSVVGDFGTTWSIAREVTADSRQAWSLYWQGLVLRTAGVLVVGGLVLGVGNFFVEGRVFLAMQLGVLIALISGATEIGMSTLRAVGSVRTESLALPIERLVFVAIAGSAVASGRGANTVLGVYVITNLITALVACHRVTVDHRRRRPDQAVRLWTTETRRTGVAFAVVALGPRANGLLLVFSASRLEVADYSVASRPVEQFSLALLGLSTSMLPLLRYDSVSGRSAGLRAGSVGATIVVVAAPGIVWAMTRPEVVIDLAFGIDRYAGAAPVLAVVALVGISWPLRGLAGLLMVADAQASRLALIAVAGLILNVLLALPLIAAYDAVGAAWALVVADVATTGVLLVVSSMRLARLQARAFLCAVGVGVAAGLLASQLPVVLAACSVAAGAAGAGWIALASHRALSRSETVIWT